MKKNSGFELRSLCGEQFLISTGIDNIDVNHMIVMNETAVFLWNAMGDGEFTLQQLVERLTDEYDVSLADATAAVEKIVDDFFNANVIIK